MEKYIFEYILAFCVIITSLYACFAFDVGLWVLEKDIIESEYSTIVEKVLSPYFIAGLLVGAGTLFLILITVVCFKIVKYFK
ncbi:MAG: hypothetical protein ACNI3H_00540 [Halarcobacter ebronensis]|uniref:hypothetical protein n=1 Tax=Halarcobacter ebronensis TaxID=1462615 RepID=UPI003C796C95